MTQIFVLPNLINSENSKKIIRELNKSNLEDIVFEIEDIDENDGTFIVNESKFEKLSLKELHLLNDFINALLTVEGINTVTLSKNYETNKYPKEILNILKIEERIQEKIKDALIKSA